MNVESFRCYLVRRDDEDRVQGHVTDQPLSALPAGEVLIRVGWSSLNYKDALAATGHPGVARRLPHVPGVDAGGTVVRSDHEDFRQGDEVLVTGYELGAGHWGGWAQYIQVPADWVVPLPAGLTLREAMVYGTAGFTAAQCVGELIHHGIGPASGEVVVTGATGGVGCLAVRLLSSLGYTVVASSGKTSRSEWLGQLGAARVIGREEVVDESDRPLLPAIWAGVVDTVGGHTLATLLRATKVGGCVTACGLVGGANLPLTVYPFILRGVRLCGITSALCPRPLRLEIWNRLAGEWNLAGIDDLVTTVGLDEIGEQVPKILRGEITGRVVVRIAQ